MEEQIIELVKQGYAVTFDLQSPNYFRLAVRKQNGNGNYRREQVDLPIQDHLTGKKIAKYLVILKDEIDKRMK